MIKILINYCKEFNTSGFEAPSIYFNYIDICDSLLDNVGRIESNNIRFHIGSKISNSIIHLYDLNKYIKKVGLLQKYALLVKLVYARDYYMDGDYVSGDKILLDVSLYNINDEDVIRLLDEVKNIRDNNKDKKILKRVKK